VRPVSRTSWTLVLVLLFVALLGWYLLYTERIVRAFRADTATMSRMFAEVQTGISDSDPQVWFESLFKLQQVIVDSEVPLILLGPGDTVHAVANLPLELELETPEGQRRARGYAERLAARNPPVGDPARFLVVFGDPPELQRLRWIPWLQVTGLLLTFVTGIVVIRFQRRAEAERAWTSMARELAHQLGTPIMSLKGWHELLRLGPSERPGGVEEGEIAREIGEDVDRLERVSRRFELIGRDTELVPLSIEDVVRSVERYLGSRIPQLGPGIRLEVEIPRSLPQVMGNDVLLTWALENVVKNALDALAGRGGTITLRVFHREPDCVTLYVEDTGPGIDPEIRDRLFEPGVSTKASGWGVGLSLSARIVRRIHSGSIEVIETGPEGTVFAIRIPIAEAPDA
jgi:signal transduction histidine kinase